MSDKFAEPDLLNKYAGTDQNQLKKEGKRLYIYGKNDKNCKMPMESKFTIADPEISIDNNTEHIATLTAE